MKNSSPTFTGLSKLLSTCKKITQITLLLKPFVNQSVYEIFALCDNLSKCRPFMLQFEVSLQNVRDTREIHVRYKQCFVLLTRFVPHFLLQKERNSKHCACV